MDTDRKSTVSSFYGAKPSLDALNDHHDFTRPGQSGQDRRRRDSSSSFFNPDAPRGSVDLLAPGRPSMGGYNKDSFFPGAREEPLKGGRDEEEDAGGWDVYADFNNAGPKYSTAFGSHDQGYQQLPVVSSPTLRKTESDTIASSGPVEMVTVPGLGPEWRKTELKELTKGGRKKARETQSWREFLRRWNRGQAACFGCITRRVFTFILFFVCVALALIIGFTLPRVPSFSSSNNQPLGNATGDWNASIPVIFSRSPANFSFPAVAQLQVDTNGNWVPLHFNYLRADVYDLDSLRLVGTGNWGRHSLPAKAFPDIQIPMNFTYIATNDSDPTWKAWYGACRNTGAYADGKRPGLKFRLLLEMGLFGLVGGRRTSTTILDANCPVELPLNAG